MWARMRGGRSYTATDGDVAGLHGKPSGNDNGTSSDRLSTLHESIARISRMDAMRMGWTAR